MTKQKKADSRRPFPRVMFFTDGPSKTMQSHAAACDINEILRRYERTGVLPPQRGVPQFADVTSLQGDLTERLEFAREVVQKTVEYNADAPRRAYEKAEKVKAEKAAAEKAAVVKPPEGNTA